MSDEIYQSEFVKRLFNKMSTSYERMNFICSFGFSIRWRKQFLNPIQTTNNTIEIIDLLTGMGETWNSLKLKFPNSNIQALDFSTEMLEHASRKNKRYYNNKISLLNENILENKLPSDYFDIVVCSFGLKTFNNEQIEILALETKRILKKGGQFSFIEVSKPDNKVLQRMYKFYLKRTIPILGRILLGNPSEYRMLWKYAEKFENAKNANEIFRTVGLKTNYNSYFKGCATGFSGHKNEI